MKIFKSGLIIIVSLGLIFLGACSNSNQTANTENSPVSSASNTKTPSVIASPVAKKQIVRMVNLKVVKLWRQELITWSS